MCSSIALACAAGNGAVCFTFDDSHSKNWVAAIPLFQKYNGHASFFFSGQIDDGKIAAMKKLQQHGHTVGLHTLNHLSAVSVMKTRGPQWYMEKQVFSQLAVCTANGVKIRSFAYPNTRRTPDTDKVLFKHFDFLRAGTGVAQRSCRPKDNPGMYYPVAKLQSKMVLGGLGMGAYYNTDYAEIELALERAAKNNEVAVFFSHNIAPGAKHIHMPTEMLERLLKKAAALKMKIIGFEELTSLK